MPTYYRRDGSINSVQGQALDGVDIYVCTQPASTGSIPPSPLATLYSDATGTPLANPVQTDGLGNYFFYTDTGTYTLVYYDTLARIPTTVFADQEVVTPGGGSVTSVALTMPAEFTVTGSPVTSSGTLAVTAADQDANTVYAGPSSGPSDVPEFRALVAADLPGGVGTVSSVGLATNPNALFTFTITGTNPITTSGTMTLNLTFANQSANVVLAGPSSGAAGPISARALVAADIFGLVPTSFSATPTFDASAFAWPTFTMTLTGNVTSSTLSNPISGQHITFIITQNATGGWTFAYPTNVKGESMVGNNANEVSVQSFVYDGTNWRACSPGQTNAS
jgi:hypothetical protein